MAIRTDVIIAVVCAPRWDVAATIAWKFTVVRGAQPPDSEEWFSQLYKLTDHAESRRRCTAMATEMRYEDLAICWKLLAIDPQAPTGLSELLMTIGTAVRGVDFDEHPQLLPRLAVMGDIANLKHVGEFGSLWHMASIYFRSRLTAEMCSAEDPLPLPRLPSAVDLLACDRWDDAFDWLYSATVDVLGPLDVKTPTDILNPSDRDERQEQILDLIEMLYGMATPETGALAFAWSMMTVSPRKPDSFIAVLPHLQWLFDNDCADGINLGEMAGLRARLRIWWRGAEGEWISLNTSMFLIAAAETDGMTFSDQDIEQIDEPVPFRRHEQKPIRPALPTLVVMPGRTATKLNQFQAPFKPLIGKSLPLVTAGDLAEIRSTLHDEYPHAQGAVDLLLRDLRDGQPVALKPMLLVGSPGSGKSRLVRRLGDLLRISVYRFDASASADNHFGGTSKAWGNTEASVPARAVLQSMKANPIIMIDEIDKSGTGMVNGSLWNVLTPFLERETASRYRDQSLDAQLDLSMVTYIATANDDTLLPAPLRDRFRVVRVPTPTLAHLPALAAQVMRDLSASDEARAFDDPLADDELAIIGRAWARAGFSVRKLQKIVAATLDARDHHAPRH